MILVIIIGFIIFDSESMAEIFDKLRGMFLMQDISLYDEISINLLNNNMVLIILSIILSTPSLKNIYFKYRDIKFFNRVLVILEPLVILSLMLIVTAYLVDGSYNPFMYFRF